MMLWTLGMTGEAASIELTCINLGESLAPWAEKFLKNLPLAPLAPPPKLGRVPSSFAIGGAFVKSILPPFRPLRPFCPPSGPLEDEMDARSEPLLVFATV